MLRFLRAGHERAVIVRVNDLLRVPAPGKVRRGVVDAQVERKAGGGIAEGARPAVVGQDVRVGHLPFEVADGVRSGVPFSLDPVVDAALGGDAAGEDRGPAGGADWRGDEEVLEADARRGQPVDVRRADLRVAVAPRRPLPLVVRSAAPNSATMRCIACTISSMCGGDGRIATGTGETVRRSSTPWIRA